MAPQYELSNQVMLATLPALLWQPKQFVSIVTQSGYDGIQHMPTRRLRALEPTDSYMERITSLHQPWRGERNLREWGRLKKNKVLGLYGQLFLPYSIAGITIMQTLQEMLNGVPNILYPQSDKQSLGTFHELTRALKGEKVVQAESLHFKWYQIDPQSDNLARIYRENKWWNCIDLVHFVQDMPVPFEDLLTQMAPLTTHVHIRTGRDLEGQGAIASTKQVLEGSGLLYERLQAIKQRCAIQYVTVEVPWVSITQATGCTTTELEMSFQYARILNKLKRVFG